MRTSSFGVLSQGMVFSGALLVALAACLWGSAPTEAAVIPQPGLVVTQAIHQVRLLPAQVIPDMLQADGNVLLFTGSTPPLDAGDLAASSQLYRYDRARQTVQLISRDASGRHSANGLSLGAVASADGRRIAFESRASNLVGGDTNETWDVFVRDFESETTWLASVATNGLSGNGASTRPMLSADGRRVLFASLALDLAAPDTRRTPLFVRDLDLRTTYAVGTGIPMLAAQADGVLAPDGRSVACRATIMPAPLSRPLPAIYLCSVNAPSNRLLAPFPASVVSGNVYDVSRPAFSEDGAWVAFVRCQRTNGRWTNELVVHDVAQATTLSLHHTTNGWPTAMPALNYQPLFADNHRFIVYGLPAQLPRSTNSVLALHQWDAVQQTSTLITRSLDGVSPANANSWPVEASADGRFVLFLSEATDLSADATTPGRRVYLWDQTTTVVQKVADVPFGVDWSPAVMDRPGSNVVSTAVTATGEPQLTWLNPRDGSTETQGIPLASTNSRTPRAWTRIGPGAAADDGTRLTLLGLGPSTGYADVFWADTRTGGRTSLAERLGRAPTANRCLPVLAARAGRVAFASGATDLLAADLNTYRDVFVFDVEQDHVLGTTLAWRSVADRNVTDHFALSPDGRYLVLEAVQATGPSRSRLVDLESGGNLLLPLPALSTPARFSHDGRRLIGLGTSGALQVAVVLELQYPFNPLTPPIVLVAVTNTLYAAELSADGHRAVLWRATGSAITNALDVIDLDTGSVVRSRLVRARGFHLSLDASGRGVAFENPVGDSALQILHWDVESDTVTLASTAPNGLDPGNSHSRFPALSPSGNLVAFASQASNLIDTDNNGEKDVFLRDLRSGQTLLLSRTADGRPGAGPSKLPMFTDSGNSLFFISHAPNLLPQDANQSADVIMVDVLGIEEGLILALSRNLTTGETRLLWNGQPGRSYRVEFRDSLGAGSWQPAPGTVGQDFSLDVDASLPKRFYRVLELP